MRRPARAVTLVELIVVIVVIGFLAAGSMELFKRFLHTSRYIPNEARVSQAASELFEAVAEGSVTTIPGAPSIPPMLRGLRYAKRALPTTTAIQLADAQEVWFTVPGGCDAATQTCLIRLRLVGTSLMRSFSKPSPVSFSPEEALPYYAEEGIRIKTEGNLGASLAVFQYYTATGTTAMAVPVASLETIGRVEIGARLYTGTLAADAFTRGKGNMSVTSSVAIRFP